MKRWGILFTLTAKIYFVSAISFFSIFWSRVLSTNSAGDWVAFHPGLYSDWTFHFSLGAFMASSTLFPLAHPLVYGVPLKYHFLSDTIAAFLARLGVPFFAAFTFTAWIYSIFFVFALFWFFKTLLKSQNLAALASLLFFLSGGTGMIEAVRTAAGSGEWVRATQFKNLGIYWNSVIDTMIIPQRPFALGIPLALTALVLVFRWMENGRLRLMAYAGILLGLLPIVHAHSLMACFLILAFWLAADLPTKRGKGWGILILTTAALATPLIVLFILSDNPGAHRWRWAPGWYAGEIKMNWLLFWWKNLGFLPILAAAGWVVAVRDRQLGSPRRTILMAAPFFLIFILGNLFNFQAWLWDNTKLFAWAVIGFSGLAALALQAAWRFETRLRPVVVLVVLGTCASGAWDAVRLQHHGLNAVTLFSKDDIDLADWAKSKTGEDTLWLTSESPNHWVPNLAGRRIIMAYNGWLWSHGLDPSGLKKDVRRMFGEPGKASDLYKKYGVDYVVLDQAAKKEFGADEAALNDAFVIVQKTDHFTVYDVEAGRYKFDQTAAVPYLTAAQQTPSGARGLRVLIFDNMDFKGNPVRTDVQTRPIEFWHNYLEDRPFPNPASMDYTGFLHAETDGVYSFYLESDDGSWLWLDDVLIVDNGGKHEVREKYGRARLEKGRHKIRIKYFDDGGGAILKFSWKPPAGVRELVPADVWRH